MEHSDRLYLREQLAPLSFTSPHSFSSDKPELAEYFRTYGFNTLAQRLDCRYFVGKLKLGRYQCIGHCWLHGRTEQAEVRPTVLLAHGLFDHAGLFLKLVEVLLKNKFSVFIADFPGHGLSEGEPADIEDFQDYSTVVSTSLLMLNQSSLFGPVSLVGQSTGAAAILRFILDEAHPVNVARVVLLAPLVRPVKWRLIRVALSVFSPILRKVPRHFNDATSHDKQFCAFLENGDTLQARHIPVQWVRAMANWVDWFEAQATRIALNKTRKQRGPLLLIQGTHDTTVDWRYNLPKIQACFEESSVTRVIDARHHLVNEDKLWQEQIFTAVVNFLKS